GALDFHPRRALAAPVTGAAGERDLAVRRERDAVAEARRAARAATGQLLPLLPPGRTGAAEDPGCPARAAVAVAADQSGRSVRREPDAESEQGARAPTRRGQLRPLPPGRAGAGEDPRRARVGRVRAGADHGD